jgi:hypothetical protein
MSNGRLEEMSRDIQIMVHPLIKSVKGGNLSVDISIGLLTRQYLVCNMVYSFPHILVSRSSVNVGGAFQPFVYVRISSEAAAFWWQIHALDSRFEASWNRSIKAFQQACEVRLDALAEESRGMYVSQRHRPAFCALCRPISDIIQYTSFAHDK